MFVFKFFLITELRYQPVLFHKFTSLNTVFIILFYKTAGLFTITNYFYVIQYVYLLIHFRMVLVRWQLSLNMAHSLLLLCRFLLIFNVINVNSLYNMSLSAGPYSLHSRNTCQMQTRRSLFIPWDSLSTLLCFLPLGTAL